MAAGVKTPEPVVSGTFNAQRFFDTLALIISRREGVKVTATVLEPKAELLQKAAV